MVEGEKEFENEGDEKDEKEEQEEQEEEEKEQEQVEEVEEVLVKTHKLSLLTDYVWSLSSSV